MKKAAEYEFYVSSEQRLDLFLLQKISEDSRLEKCTRSQIKHLIEKGKVSVSRRKVFKAGHLLKPGNTVSFKTLDRENTQIEPWDFEIPLIYEDQKLIVINKPAGISMHPGAGRKSQTILNALASHFSKDLFAENTAHRAGIVHRLDKDTSGVVVLAKDLPTLHFLSAQFSKRQVEKKYIALALSSRRSRRLINKSDNGLLETLLGRDAKNRLKMAVVAEGGRKALTSWKVIDRMHYACLLEVNLLTGRTHQIRVHFDHIKSPLIGDPLYGDFSLLPAKLNRAALDFGRQALHSKSLKFIPPTSGKPMLFESQIPPDMEEIIGKFRNYRA